MIALLIGIIIAGAATQISYSCPLTDGAKGCVLFEKAVMHPADLLHNKQDSLLHFTSYFVIVTLLAVAVFKLIAVAKNRKERML